MMVYFVLLLCCLGGLQLVSSAPRRFYDLHEAELFFEKFMKDHEKYYANDEEKNMRFEIFKKSLERVNEWNRLSKNAVFGVTKFSDLTPEEFKQMYLGLKPESTSPFTILTEIPSGFNTSAPYDGNFDWRDKHVVTRVKNQQACGSCWAFSTTGNIEAQYAIKHNQLIELSESQLVDCDMSSHGCVGGFPSSAISYLAQAGGSMSEQDYPYQPSQQSCRFDRSKVAVTVTNLKQYNVQSEDDLARLLSQVGPISFGLDGKSFPGYHGGIMDYCDNTEINHAVLLVGYGSENGMPYWLVKNSYGTAWGEQGYIRLQRGVNMCGMMQGSFVSAVIA